MSSAGRIAWVVKIFEGSRMCPVKNSSTPLKLMAVHAHPDDEATSTGGVLARYALAGVQTIVVTCTNGELGDAPGGIKPGADGHDPRTVASIRLAELRTACAHLGVSTLELLGYHDSGMADWDHRHRPDVFCTVPVETAAARITGLIERHRPQVVVSYDVDGTYQHPDHLHAARATARAVELAGIPVKLYSKAHGTTYWRRLREALTQVGVELRGPEPGALESVERRITTSIDVSAVIERKRDALHAHESQLNSSLAAKLPLDLFSYAFGTETYVLTGGVANSALPEVDLFAGVRGGHDDGPTA